MCHDTDDFVAHDAGVGRCVGTPAGAECVEVGAADAAVGYVDFDVRGSEGFRGVRGVG